MVSALPRLCALDISCNPQLTQEVDAGGFRELAAAFSHATALTTLRLQACGLTTDCLDALGRRCTVTVSTVCMRQFSVAGCRCPESGGMGADIVSYIDD